MLNPVPEFEQMKARVVEAIRAQFPFNGKKNRLELVNVEILDSGDKPSDKFHIDNIQSQYDSKVAGGTWAVPIRATLRLVDVATGKPKDQAYVTLGRLPKITRRYSYIVDGHERQHDMLFRSKSRPYHLVADNGEITAKWNLAKGMGFDLHIDRATGRFEMKLGTSHIPLYSVLRALGVSDAEMERSWGAKILEANRVRTKDEDLVKIHKVLAGKGDKNYKAPPAADVHAFVKKTFEATVVRPDAMLAAFGKPFTGVNGENLLLSSTRLLNISRGKEEEDDRQALSAKDLVGTTDFVVESIQKKTLELTKKIQNNLDQKDKISDIVSANAYSKVIRSAFEPAQRPDQTNPLQFVSGYMRTTIRSENFGGVKGEQVNLSRDKLINPTHLGFLDPIQTPDSEDVGIALHLPLGVKKDGVELRTRVYNVRTRTSEWKTPGELERSVVAYPDQVTWPKGRDNPPTPLAPEVVVYDSDRKTTKRAWKDVEYVLLSAKGLFSFAANLVPFLQNNSGNRAQFAAKQQEQALALLHREVPLVQSKSDGGPTFDQVLGAFNSHIAPLDGVVKKIEGNTVLIQGAGKQISKVQLYDHFPLNGGRNMLHATPVVKAGDRVKKGQLLADTNYSVSGKEEVLVRLGETVDRVRLEELEHVPGLEVLALDCDRLIYEWKPLKELIKHPTTDPLVEVQTRSGRTMRVTASHSCLTVDADGQIVKVRPKDMVPGQTLLPVAGSIEESAKPWSLLPYLPLNRFQRNATKWFLGEAALTEDLGFLLGIYLAEGDVSVRKYVRIAATVPEIRERVKASFRALELEPHETPTTIEVGCAHLARALVAEFGTGSREKFVAGWVFSAPVRFRQALVDGFWSGDGSVYLDATGKPRAGFQVDSEQLAKDMQALLAGLGIQSSYQYFHRKYAQFKAANEDHYRVFVGASDVGKLPPFTHPDKEANRLRWGPVEKDILCVAPVPRHLTKGALRQKGKKGYCGRSYVLREATDPRVRALAGGAVLWDVVESITEVEPEEFVYDLSVGDHETFVLASGLTVHNTKQGHLALGANIRVAYLPYHGLNFEDGIVVSESAAKKLTSVHLHQESATQWPGMILDKKRWADYALPERVTPERMAKLDSDGVIRIGQRVQQGDVLVAMLTPTRRVKEDEDLALIHRSLVKDYRDAALIWDHEYPGEVVKVIRSGNKIQVHVKTEETLAAGDKLSGRHGNKGIVSRIVPDHEMPKDKGGTHVDMLLNPAGVPGRMNIGQVLETAASKIARKTGQPYVVENFIPGVDYAQKVKDELKKHGLSDTEELIDPKTGTSLGQVMTGEQYMLKLHHVVDKKMTARSYGTGYGVHGMAPSGSGIPGGGQKLDQLTTYAMLAHGAKHNLREAYTFKADADQSDVWLAVQTGRPLPPPRPARVMRNFLDYMRAMGVHTEKKGSEYVLAPMTDKQTLSMSNGALKFPDKALKAKGALTREEVGGLFDRQKTGGLEGKYWSHIHLQQRVPNPVFEGAITTLLDMKEKEFDDLVGVNGVRGGKSGFDFITERLKGVDVAKDLKRLETDLPKLKGTELSRAYKKIRYLRNLQELKVTPLDAYTNQVLPVVPPSIRRVSVGLDGKQIFDDLNGLYLAVGQINQQIAKADSALPVTELQKQKAALYDAVRALRLSGMDMGDIGKKRHHFGLMEKLKGDQPKTSFFHDQVMGRRQDLSARSTIVPLPELGIDELGMPQPVALELYKPFIVRELHTTRGYTPLEAQKLVQKKDPIALEALEKVVNERPVLMKRDPALHKFSVMAFKPKLISGKAIGLHPLVTGGFNADFDGDAMAIYVPVGTEAVDEAKKMLPSQNLFSPTHGRIMAVPAQDSLMGIYQCTTWGTEAKIPQGTTAPQIVKMLHDGKLKSTDVVTVNARKTTAGRIALNEALPPAMRGDEKLLYDRAFVFNKGTLVKYLDTIGKKYPNEFGATIDAWKNLGNRLSYLNGTSFSLNDFHDGKDFRDAVFKPYLVEEKKILSGKGSKEEKDKQLTELWMKANKELKQRGEARYASLAQNRVFDWNAAGAGKSWTQFAQLVFGPVLVADAKGVPVPVPIKRSWGEGLPLSEYWTSLHGARKGAIDRSINTRDPGSLTKDIINTVINIHVTAEDCGSDKGVFLPVEDPDVPGRFLAQAVQLKNGKSLPAKTEIIPAVIAELRAGGVQKIVVRSPLHCRQSRGVCATCYGHAEHGKLHAVGTNVGVIAGHALGEPVTQLVMKQFHSGGAVGAGASVVDGFSRAKQLFHVPKTLPNSATLATTEGKVQRVVKNATLGGTDIFIADKRHYVPATQTVLPAVVVGHEVKKGEALSSGPTNPHELLALTKDIHKVRAYMTDELATVYEGSTKRRNVETVVRGLTNLTHVDHTPEGGHFMRGQVVPLAELEAHNRQARQQGGAAVQHTPILKPMTEVPLLVQEDWMARLNYRNLERTYTEGAAQGWKSDIHGHPVPGLAHGAEFGLLNPF